MCLYLVGCFLKINLLLIDMYLDLVLLILKKGKKVNIFRIEEVEV